MIQLENYYSIIIKAIVILAIFQCAILAFDYLSLQYITATVADEIAKDGEFTDAAANRIANHLRKWTFTSPDTIARTDYNATSTDAAVIWGPAPGTVIQRGQPFTVGANLPVKSQLLIIDNLYCWVLSEEIIILKSSFTALSDRYIELGYEGD